MACGAHGVLRARWGSCTHKCGDSALPDNPSMFTNPLQLEIEYECLVNLEDGARLNSFQVFCCTFQCSIAVATLHTCAEAASPTRPPDLEWKLTYVGSAESNDYDQCLDSVLVGPVMVGSYRFVFQAGWHAYVFKMSISLLKNKYVANPLRIFAP